MTKKSYVVGFMFDNTHELVLLIERHPRRADMKWQEGCWNGVGGGIEEGETMYQAMSREFEEEAGYPTLPEQWQHFATLSNEFVDVHFLWSQITMDTLDFIVTEQDPEASEPVKMFPVSFDVPEWDKNRVIANLFWLVPLALCRERYVDVIRAEFAEAPTEKVDA